MHHIYHTEAIILGSRNHGEAGKYYFLFTRDLGLIYASAQGVRKMSSKLRYILHDYAYVKVDLVQGRDFWRLTSATKTNELESITKNKNHLKIVTNIAHLLKSLLAGVEPNVALFDDLLFGLKMLEGAESVEDLQNIEIIIVLRMVHNLGYIGGDDFVQTLIQSPFEKDLIFEAAKNRKAILNEINKALKETHL